MATFRTSQAVSAADLAAEQLPHLILVGLPGAGKTSVGRAAAEQLGRRFLDFDAEIERREGVTIAEIFASSGEQRFRALEQRLTQELKAESGYLLAPGGGWIANPGCLEALRPPSVLVYLQLEPARALKRMASSAQARPLLRRADPLAELTKLLADREALYLLADHTVRVDFLRENEVVSRIVALARGERQD
jgi:shikimate kinase